MSLQARTPAPSSRRRASSACVCSTSQSSSRPCSSRLHSCTHDAVAASTADQAQSKRQTVVSPLRLPLDHVALYLPRQPTAFSTSSVPCANGERSALGL